MEDTFVDLNPHWQRWYARVKNLWLSWGGVAKQSWITGPRSQAEGLCCECVFMSSSRNALSGNCIMPDGSTLENSIWSCGWSMFHWRRFYVWTPSIWDSNMMWIHHGSSRRRSEYMYLQLVKEFYLNWWKVKLIAWIIHCSIFLKCNKIIHWLEQILMGWILLHIKFAAELSFGMVDSNQSF